MNKYIAELYGTFLLVLAIVGTFIMTQSLGAPSYVTLLTVALAVSLVLLSNITIFSKVITANELDNVGACAGVVIGNASVDFSLGDQKGFDDGIKLGITAYVSQVFANNYSKNDIAIADKILASNTDKIINAANTQTFDETIFEGLPMPKNIWDNEKSFSEGSYSGKALSSVEDFKNL